MTIDELCRALRAPERQGAIQILIVIVIIYLHGNIMGRFLKSGPEREVVSH